LLGNLRDLVDIDLADAPDHCVDCAQHIIWAGLARRDIVRSCMQHVTQQIQDAVGLNVLFFADDSLYSNGGLAIMSLLHQLHHAALFILHHFC
jgi:hypothetical protein